MITTTRFPPLRPESDHLLHLDALRLIASTGIIFLHLSAFLDIGNSSIRLQRIVDPLNLFVDMFFVISGFVIAYVYFTKIADSRSYQSFLLKRLARLAPLHWATLAIFVFLGIAATYKHIPINHAESFDLKCVPVNLFFLQATGLCPLSFNLPAWSISAEMCMYVCTPMLFWLLRRSTGAVGLLAVVVWLTLTLVTRHSTASWLEWKADGGAIRAIPSFSLGVWMFGSRQWIGRFRHARGGFWLGVAAFLCGCCVEIPEPVLLIVLYITVVLAVAADAKRRQGGLLRMLAAGGQLTYSSYMLQELVIVVFVSSAADHVLHLHGSGKNIMVLLAFALIWVVSYLSLVFFERPARRWLGRSDSQRHAMAARSAIG